MTTPSQDATLKSPPPFLRAQFLGASTDEGRMRVLVGLEQRHRFHGGIQTAVRALKVPVEARLRVARKEAAAKAELADRHVRAGDEAGGSAETVVG